MLKSLSEAILCVVSRQITHVEIVEVGLCLRNVFRRAATALLLGNEVRNSQLERLA